MTSHLINSLVEELNIKLGDRPFYTLKQLITIGLFGSMPAARMALHQGHLAFVKVSQRRLVIPRLVLLEYLQKNVSDPKTTENELLDI